MFLDSHDNLAVHKSVQYVQDRIVGHLKVPLIEAQGLGAKFVFSF